MAADVTPTREVSAVILAAGLSSRMGKLKPLLPFGKGTVLEHCIQLFQGSGINEVIVVTGHRNDEVECVARRAGATAVHNPQFTQGMYTSIRAGAFAVSNKSCGFFLLPVDIPVVRTGTIRLVLNEFAAKHPLVTHPLFAGKRGHPPLLSAQLIPTIKAMVHPEGGMRSILQQVEGENPSAVCSVQVADANIHSDMDIPDEYSRACQLLKQCDYPTMEECQVILNKIHPLDDRIRRHSQVVAETATAMCSAINKKGNHQLDPVLCRVGGLLHDIAKGEPEHDKTGAQWLTALGFPRVAEIIAAHKDITITKAQDVSEEELVYIADKMAKGDQLVTIEQRFDNKLQLFKDNPEASQAVKRRFNQAKTVATRVEQAMGKPLTHFMRSTVS